MPRVVAAQLAAGRVVYAAGDSNFDGLHVDGLTSGWEGHPGASFGSRRIDDVFGPGPAEAVQLVETASDHRAVLVRRADGSGG